MSNLKKMEIQIPCDSSKDESEEISINENSSTIKFEKDNDFSDFASAQTEGISEANSSEDEMDEVNLCDLHEPFNCRKCSVEKKFKQSEHYNGEIPELADSEADSSEDEIDEVNLCDHQATARLLVS